MPSTADFIVARMATVRLDIEGEAIFRFLQLPLWRPVDHPPPTRPTLSVWHWEEGSRTPHYITRRLNVFEATWLHASAAVFVTGLHVVTETCNTENKSTPSGNNCHLRLLGKPSSGRHWGQRDLTCATDVSPFYRDMVFGNKYMLVETFRPRYR